MGGAGFLRRGLAALSVLLASGCATGGTSVAPTPRESPAPSPAVSDSEQAFLLDPIVGYPLVLPPEAGRQLSEAYRSLLDESRADAAKAAADALLARDPGLHPALVLRAEAAFVAGDYRSAVDDLRPVAEELPAYAAAHLILGRAHELLGDLPAAYAAYRGLDGSETAHLRAVAIAERAREIVAHRATDAMRRGRWDEARVQADLLLEWAPAEPETFELVISLARETGDALGELDAIRGLTEIVSPDRPLLERRGDLELEVGDPGRGLEIFRALSAEFPADGVIADKLGFALFRWRLTLLPDRVQDVALKPELERGDFAVLLYWLVPSVRYGRAEGVRIAGDILDDPRRQEIARVINLRVMDVNETLHRFSPEKAVTRAEVLGSLLRILAGSKPPVACVRGYPRRPSFETVCTTASRCGLLPGPQQCLATAPLAGAEAVRVIRRGLELVESR